MFHTRCCSLVPYTIKQMFNLINDINSYHEFIPGCSIIRPIQKNDSELIAEISYIINGSIQSIITHNFFIRYKSIVIVLIKSPFKFYYGYWNFTSVNDKISSVEYISYYEFQSIFFEKICNYVFQKACNNMMKIFIDRAHKIYSSSKYI